MSIAQLLRAPWILSSHPNSPSLVNCDGDFALEGLFVGEGRQIRKEALVSLVNTGPLIEKALEIAKDGQIDGAHHKTWIIDQMVRALTGNGYKAFVQAYDGEWDEGIAP